MILLARALVRVISFVLLVILAVAGLVLAVFCISTGTSGPSLGGLAHLLDLGSLRDTVGSWLGQLEASGAVAGIAAVCGLAAMLLGLLLLAGILVPRRERLVTLASGEHGTIAARRRPLAQAATALVAAGAGRHRSPRPRPAAAPVGRPPGRARLPHPTSPILKKCRAPCASSFAVSPSRSSSRPASTLRAAARGCSRCLASGCASEPRHCSSWGAWSRCCSRSR